MKKILIGSILAWLVIYGAVYTIAYVNLGIERMDVLANFGKTTNGTVAAKRPEQHRSIIYYYVIDDIQYTGSGGGGYGNPDFDDIDVGDKMIVTYNEDNPFESSLGYARKGESERMMAILLAVIFSTAIVGQALGIYFIVRYVRKQRLEG